ncbi:Uncharacterised protein [Acinetobacter baumannii]|nr:Uncharacterised protein [Acinetobacter baumannii]
MACLPSLSRLTLSTLQLARSSNSGVWRSAGRMFRFGEALEYM